MKVERRKFLGTAIASTAGAVATGQFAVAEPVAVPLSTDPTAMVPLTKDIQVTRIGMGTGMKGWYRVSNLTRRGHDHTIMMLRRAYDEGIRLFDMADLYGIHNYVAEALKDKPRDSYTLVSKIWFHPRGLTEEERPDADVCVRRFLKELNTDYIDVVHLHCQMKREWPTEMRKQMDLLEELKQKGVIRAHGCSCHSVPALEAAAEEPWVDVINTRINPEGVKMDGPPEKVVPAQKKVKAAGKGIIGMKVIGEGAFAKDPEKRKKSVEFVMGLGIIDAMVVGFEVPEEIVEFKQRVKDVLVAQAEAKKASQPA